MNREFPCTHIPSPHHLSFIHSFISHDRQSSIRQNSFATRRRPVPHTAPFCVCQPSVTVTEHPRQSAYEKKRIIVAKSQQFQSVVTWSWGFRFVVSRNLMEKALSSWWVGSKRDRDRKGHYSLPGSPPNHLTSSPGLSLKASATS